MAVPNTFATAVAPIPLSKLDTNFATPITLGSTAVALGDTVTNVTGLNTTGTAANITATSNSTLTTLSVLSLPYSQLSGTVPTWNQNTTGTSSNVTGTVAIANGGTNLTTYATGDIIYASAANTLSKLAAGTNGYVLTLASGVPTWAAASGGGTTTNALTIGTGLSGTSFNGSAAVTIAIDSTVATLSGTQTLTNKRINPRVNSVASAASAVTPDISAYDVYAFTAQAATLTINAPTGTPVDGNKLMFRILDNGTARTIAFNATFTAMGVTIPTTTTANKTTYVGAVYNANNTRWDVIAVTTQA